MTTREQHTFCRICAAMCGLVVTVDDHPDGSSTVDKVRGDDDHPVSRGYSCVKGRALPRYHHHESRLDHPMMRSSRSDELAPVLWSQVLDDLAATIARNVAEHGADSVGIYNGTASAFDSTGRPTIERMLRLLGSEQRYSSLTVDTPAKPLVAELVAGWANIFPNIHAGTSGTVVMVGTNPVVSHGQAMALPDPVQRLRDLARNGARMWVVDPRRTETAVLVESLGGRHLQPRPSTDWLLLAFLVRELLMPGGGADLHELATTVDPSDLEVVRAELAPFTLDVVADRTGLSSGDLGALLASIRLDDGLSIVTGTGTTMQRAANVTEWLSWLTMIVTGSLDRPSGMWCNPGFVRQAHRVPPRGGVSSRRPGPASRPELSRRFGEVPCSALVSEIESGNLRVLIIFGGNPLTSIPEGERMARALTQLDALAVIDVVRNEVTDLATHVLSARGQLERADIPLVGDNLQIAYTSQFTEAVVSAPEGRRPVWWMIAELADRLGLPSILPEGLDSTNATDEILLANTLRRAAAPLEELRSHPSGMVRDEPLFGWVHEQVLPDGRWRVAPAELVAQLRELVTIERAPLVLIPRRIGKVMNSQLHGITTDDAEGVHLNADDAARLGIADGAMVIVCTAYGEVDTVAHIDPNVGRGAAAMTHGWQTPNAGHVTSTTHGVDPLTGMVELSGVPVTVLAR